MVIAHYEIISRLYSMKKSIIDYSPTAHETAKIIQDLIDEIEHEPKAS